MNLKNKNIICIDFKNIDNKKINILNVKYGISKDYLSFIKEEKEMQKAFFDIDAMKLIAYTLNTKEDLYKYTYKGMMFMDGSNNLSKREKDSLLKMKSIDYNSLKNTVVKSDSVKSDVINIKSVVILDTDSILDKISKYGIASLIKEEKDFLDNLYK